MGEVEVYSATQVTALLGQKANTSHTHDDRYYTESEINTQMAGKSATTHTHTASQITNFNAAVDARIPSGGGSASSGIVSSADHATLQAALNATAAGQICYIPAGTYNIGTSLSWPNNVTIDGRGQATIKLTANIAAFTLQAGHSAPVMRGLRIVGTLVSGSRANTAVQYAVLGMDSTAANPTKNLLFENCTFEDIHGSAINLKHCVDFNIRDCTFRNYGYAGIMMYSALRGHIKSNTFYGTNLLPTFSVNSYAAAVTAYEPDDVNNQTTTPSSQDVIFESNIIYDQAWEALETHGGKRITFANNIFKNCLGAAISAVGHGGDTTTCEDINVSGNTIIGPALGLARIGITIRGAVPGSVNGSWVTGTITGNVVRRTGDSLDERYTGGIGVSNGRGVTVTGNQVEECRGFGIGIQDSPDSVVAGNTVRDIWRASGTSCAFSVIRLSLTSFSSTISNNRMVRGELATGQLPGGSNINLAGIHGTNDSGIEVYQDNNAWPPGTLFGNSQRALRGVMREFREMRGGGAPTSLTWIVGDRVLNTSPATGQPIGWVCTVSGTPGTWKAYGTIS